MQQIIAWQSTKATKSCHDHPPSTRPNGIAKDHAEIMEVWIQNESACPPAMRQLPNSSINLHNVDFFYTWMKKISPKDAAVFKQQFQHLFPASGWFNTLTNAEFSNEDSIHNFIHLCALLNPVPNPISNLQSPSPHPICGTRSLRLIPGHCTSCSPSTFDHTNSIQVILQSSVLTQPSSPMSPDLVQSHPSSSLNS